jgi:hypothetical protein
MIVENNCLILHILQMGENEMTLNFSHRILDFANQIMVLFVQNVIVNNPVRNIVIQWSLVRYELCCTLYRERARVDERTAGSYARCRAMLNC